MAHVAIFAKSQDETSHSNYWNTIIRITIQHLCWMCLSLWQNRIRTVVATVVTEGAKRKNKTGGGSKKKRRKKSKACDNLLFILSLFEYQFSLMAHVANIANPNLRSAWRALVCLRCARNGPSSRSSVVWRSMAYWCRCAHVPLRQKGTL